MPCAMLYPTNIAVVERTARHRVEEAIAASSDNNTV